MIQKFLNRILFWYFKRSSLPYWVVLVADSLILLGASVLVYWMFHRGYQTMLHFWQLMHTMLVYLAVSLVTFKLYRTYAGIVRFSSFVDLKRVGYANLVALAVVIVLHYPMYRLPEETFAHLRTQEIIPIYIIATMMMWAMRVLAKTVYESMTTDRRALKALIYGVQDGGVGLAKNIRTQRPTRFVLNGFITTDKGYAHHSLMGERVYTDMDELRRVIRQQHIDAVLVSPQCNQGFRRNQALQDMLIGERVKIYMVSAAEEWTGEGESKGIQVKEVSVEDLLPRDEIRIDMKSVGELLKGRRVLITGAAGSIGSEIVRQVAEYGPEGMMLIDQAETPMHDIRLMMANEFPQIQAETVVTSISRKTRMEAIFSTFRPDYVFHAAAYKHVPMMEDNPSEAVLNNIYGTKVVADYAVKYGVKKFVMVSTDKAVNPTNVMGCSKRICEIYVQSLNKKVKTQFVTTRFGNVLGSNGSVIPLFKEQIKHGGPVTVTHPDIIRYFMLIPEACKLVLEAGTKGNGGEIFVFDMGEPVKIADLARRMINLSGAKGVEIKFTGLREGEKLYEEVLNEKEGTKPTLHEKIRIAEVREYDYDEVAKEIDELIDISKRYDNMATVRKMKEIVPEYKSNNSVYEQIDAELAARTEQ